MDNLEGSVNGMVRYCIYKLSGNSSRNMISNEFDCLTLLNSLLMPRKFDPSFVAVEPRGTLFVRQPVSSSPVYWNL